MIRGIPNLAVPAIIHTLPQDGRISFPVNSSALPYSHFRHVSGVPAPEGTHGVPISRLHLLDTLIAQLSQVNRASSTSTSANQYDGHDVLIRELENQVREAAAASEAMPYIPAPVAQSGAIFNLSI